MKNLSKNTRCVLALTITLLVITSMGFVLNLAWGRYAIWEKYKEGSYDEVVHAKLYEMTKQVDTSVWFYEKDLPTMLVKKVDSDTLLTVYNNCSDIKSMKSDFERYELFEKVDRLNVKRLNGFLDVCTELGTFAHSRDLTYGDISNAAKKLGALNDETWHERQKNQLAYGKKLVESMKSWTTKTSEKIN